MPLAAGDKLGPYEILASLGAGGMGEVYRARDAKLNRDVAIKVLPAALAGDAQYMARFEREAQMLAAQNHPNIATVYGIEQGALVMELIEGADLKGPLPVDEALAIARQIAAGLEAAHERGIIHRDLKPANIKLTPTGVVKILDFGLAKSAVESTSTASGSNPTISPTLSLAMTQAGMILGTAAYMSPEQARGKAVDKRADIWAFGVVFYELLTGKQLFGGGETVTDTLASVVKDTPNLKALSAGTPPHIRALLERCLRKDVKTRLRDIGEARIILENVPGFESPSGGAAVTKTGKLAWALLALVFLGLCGLSWVHFRERPPVAPLVRFQIPAPEKAIYGSLLALSPDGTRIAFRAKDTDYRIWVRSLDALDAHPLAGTEGTTNLFWSPDSRSIAFAVPGKLKKVEVSGGPVEAITDIAGGGFFGGAWAPDGTVVFGAQWMGLMRVSEHGGAPVPLRVPDSRRATFALSPSFLPDGRHFVYEFCADDCGIYLRSLDAKPDEADSAPLVKTVGYLGASDTAVVYAPSPDPGWGYVLFERDGSLMALTFDVRRLKPAGAAVPSAEGIAAGKQLSVALSLGPRSYSASANGILAFLPNPSAATDSRLFWFDRQGRQLGQVGPPGLYGEVALSPDGKLLAVDRITGRGFDHIYTADPTRGVFSRLNPGEAIDYASDAISPDGRIAFTYLADGIHGDIYVMNASGTGSPALVFKSETLKHPNHWSPDGRFVIYDEHTAQKQDLWVVPMSGDHRPIPFLVTAADETSANFSPDSRWVAYRSDESGQREVYVQGFLPDHVPAAGIGKWQISTAGGDKPRWRHDGKEIYYIALDGMLMAVPVTSSATTFQPGIAVPLFETHTRGYVPYDVSPDGRFLINTVADEAASRSTAITVVLNWWTALKK